MARAAKAVGLLAVAVLIHGVAAAPAISLPINAQVPPVAHVDEAYNFTFSDATFTSSSNSIQYSLSNQPSWLSLDSASRTFTGTPSAGDAGSPVFNLNAVDNTGTTTMSVTFVVTTDPGPSVGLSVEDQLPAYGAFSSPNSILLAPGSPLTISFSRNTFTNTNANTVYYAVSINNTPLPSWIHFDPIALSFTGTTPPAGTAISQAYGIEMTASNVVGFGSAIVSFQIVVESHLLAFNSAVQIINITGAASVQDSSIRDGLMLDGQPISESAITSATSEPPSWLSFDPKSLSLSGTAPEHVQAQNFTVSVTDSYGDTATTLIALQTTNMSAASLLNPVGTVNATVGTDFVYHLGQLINASNVQLSVDLGLASNWLSFNKSSENIEGRVPTDLRPQQVIVNVTAMQGSQSQSEILSIAVQSADSTSSSSSDSSSSSAGTSSDVESHHTSPHAWIAGAVIGSIAGVLLAVALLFCCLRRRRERKDIEVPPAAADDDADMSSLSTRFDSPIVENVAEEYDDEGMADSILAEKRSSKASRPPKIPFPWERSKLRSWGPASSRTSLIEHQERVERPDSWQSWQRFTGYFSNQGRPKSNRASELNRILETSTNSIAELPDTRVRPKASLLKKASMNQSELSSQPKGSRKQRGSSNMSLGSQGRLYSQVVWGFGHGRMDPNRAHESMMMSSGRRNGQVAGRFSQMGPPGFNTVQRSVRAQKKESQSTSDWTETTAGDSEPRVIEKPPVEQPSWRTQPTIRPVWPSAGTVNDPRTSFLSPAGGRMSIPKSAKVRQSSGNPFMSGRVLTRSVRRTRSRSSSLDPPARPSPDKPETSPERRRRLFDRVGWPRVIDVHSVVMSPRGSRSGWPGHDPRFESAVPSESQSMRSWNDEDDDDAVHRNFFGQDRTLASGPGSPRLMGLSAAVLASRRHSGPFEELTNKLAKSAMQQPGEKPLRTGRPRAGSAGSTSLPLHRLSHSSSSSAVLEAQSNSLKQQQADSQYSLSHPYNAGGRRRRHHSSSFLDELSLLSSVVKRSSFPDNGDLHSQSQRVSRMSNNPNSTAIDPSRSSMSITTSPLQQKHPQSHITAANRSRYHHLPGRGSTSDDDGNVNVIFTHRARQPKEAGLHRDDPANMSLKGEIKRYVPSIGTSGEGGRSIDEEDEAALAAATTASGSGGHAHPATLAATPSRVADDEEMGRGRTRSREQSPYFL